MRHHLTLVFFSAMIFAGCGPQEKNNKEASADSVIVSSQYVVTNDDSVYVPEGDANELQQTMRSLVEDQSKKSSFLFHLHLTSEGPDFRTEETWSFDSTLAIVYCKQQWRNDDSEGYAHHFFKRQQLYAFMEENKVDGTREMKFFIPDEGGLVVRKQNKLDSTGDPLEWKVLGDAEADLRKRFSEIALLISQNRDKVTGKIFPVLELSVPVNDQPKQVEVIKMEIDPLILERIDGQSKTGEKTK